MKKRFLLFVAIAVGMLQTKAQTMFEAAQTDEAAQMEVSLEMGEELPPDGYDGFNDGGIHDELTEMQRTAIWDQIHKNTAKLKALGIIPEAPVAGIVPGEGFRYPLKLSVGDFVYNWNAFYWNSNFVDENPAAGAVLDYACGSRTYDIPGYNHQGQDIAIWPFSWNLVAGNYAQVVAAQGGWITFKQDGNFDMNCGFGGGDWNAVYLQHNDGSVTWYGHMKNGSLTAKPIGAWVNKGEYLGVVASSGQSTGPHLHFEVYDAAGNLIDPNAGPCNALGGTNWWKDPTPYYNSKINAVYTHCAPPTFMACPNMDITNICDTYYPGSLVYFFSYFTETLAGQHAFYQIYKPDGSLWTQWNYTFPLSYMASYWYWSFVLPAGNTGIWTFKVKFKGKLLTYYFNVVNPLDGVGDVERNDNANRIYWLNDAAFEGADFTVERSTNKLDSKVIAAIPAVNAEEQAMYEWFDDYTSADPVYYRVVSHFSNEQVIYGDWLTVKSTQAETQFNEFVYPVPANNELMVVLNGASGTSVMYTISDIIGKAIESLNTTFELDNLLQIDIEMLPPGMYLLTTQINNQTQSFKFVKS